jgi:hypothetical protein
MCDACRRSNSSSIEQPEPAITKLIVDSVAIEKDRDRWRRALNDCTPGGSEFARDPDYCKKYVQERRDSLWKLNVKFVMENRDLREALDDAIKTLRLVRNGAEGKEIQTLARDVVDKLEEIRVGRAKQTEDPGPGEAFNAIARKECL